MARYLVPVEPSEPFSAGMTFPPFTSVALRRLPECAHEGEAVLLSASSRLSGARLVRGTSDCVPRPNGPCLVTESVYAWFPRDQQRRLAELVRALPPSNCPDAPREPTCRDTQITISHVTAMHEVIEWQGSDFCITGELAPEYVVAFDALRAFLDDLASQARPPSWIDLVGD